VLLGRRKTWAGGRGKEGGELGRGKETGRVREAGRRWEAGQRAEREGVRDLGEGFVFFSKPFSLKPFFLNSF
jgi:hypothetical protein